MHDREKRHYFRNVDREGKAKRSMEASVDLVKQMKEEIINIAVRNIEPNKFNANVMSEAEFQSLKQGMKVTGP